jgi:beta-galactosidase
VRGWRVITSVCLLALVSGCARNVTSSKVLASQLSSTGRSPPAEITINQDWRFIRSDMSGAQAAVFDDSSWQSITLPHTWNNLDGQDGGNDYYRGPGWYRRHLHIPGGQHYYLRFEGASIDAKVFVNGTPVGSHHNAFGAFCFDITSAVKPGDNIVAVRVDNTRFDDVPPLSGDFTVFGGIYRSVHLLALNDVSLSPTDDASPGIYLMPLAVSENAADVRVTTKLHNRSATDRNATVVCTITDAAGHDVTIATSTVPLKANASADAVQGVRIERPHLWNGRLDPYLYRATVQILLDGAEVDRVEQPLGLRYFHLDPKQGLLLNGTPYPLHGVNRHQDGLDKGWAISDADQAEDLAIMLEMGTTCVRLAHYQHADTIYGLCDRSGLVVWAENCLVNQLKRTDAFENNTLQQLRELIKQNYNHPSILMWSLFNELEFGKSNDPSNWELVSKLNDLSHELDPHRITVGASNQAPDHPANRIPDAIAYNGYWGWYFDKITDWGPKLDRYPAAAPGRAIGVSEYGVGASAYMHEVPPSHPNPVGWWRAEEFQCEFHETVWQVMKQRPWLWCQLIWCQFDFAVDSRREGDHLGRNDKGLVTYDRKIRKDAYYFYKANWSSDPFVYITSRRYAVRPTGPTTLKVYSNADSVELFINDHSFGRRESDDIHRFIWDVSLSEGPAKVRAVGSRNGKTYVDEVAWTISPSATTRFATPGMIQTTEASVKQKNKPVSTTTAPSKP